MSVCLCGVCLSVCECVCAHLHRRLEFDLLCCFSGVLFCALEIGSLTSAKISIAETRINLAYELQDSECLWFHNTAITSMRQMWLTWFHTTGITSMNHMWLIWFHTTGITSMYHMWINSCLHAFIASALLTVILSWTLVFYV